MENLPAKIALILSVINMVTICFLVSNDSRMLNIMGAQNQAVLVMGEKVSHLDIIDTAMVDYKHQEAKWAMNCAYNNGDYTKQGDGSWRCDLSKNNK